MAFGSDIYHRFYSPDIKMDSFLTEAVAECSREKRAVLLLTTIDYTALLMLYGVLAVSISLESQEITGLAISRVRDFFKQLK